MKVEELKELQKSGNKSDVRHQARVLKAVIEFMQEFENKLGEVDKKVSIPQPVKPKTLATTGVKKKK